MATSSKLKGIYVYGMTLSKADIIYDQSPMYGPFKAVRLFSTALLDDNGAIIFSYDFRINRWKLSDGSDWGFTDIVIVDEQGIEVGPSSN